MRGYDKVSVSMLRDRNGSVLSGGVVVDLPSEGLAVVLTEEDAERLRQQLTTCRGRLRRARQRAEHGYLSAAS
ncbi:hypothetical protein [Acidipropionibacterium jensenii]|uniref:hypothetical protein n=1 Tax=Acidipropionibacterium jensenii TaxID=1749 RepID=UPI000F83511B|nr:hypothetical protein [Acidipropionibacterium jensenii]